MAFQDTLPFSIWLLIVTVNHVLKSQGYFFFFLRPVNVNHECECQYELWGQSTNVERWDDITYFILTPAYT